MVIRKIIEETETGRGDRKRYMRERRGERKKEEGEEVNTREHGNMSKSVNFKEHSREGTRAREKKQQGRRHASLSPSPPLFLSG